MAADIRMADFFGCGGGSNITSRIDTANVSYNPSLHDFTLGIEGTDDANGDSITIRRAAKPGLTVQGHSDPMGGNSGGAGDPVIVPGSQAVVEKIMCEYSGCLDNSVADIALVTDCEDGDIFQVTSLATGSPSSQTDIDFTASPSGSAAGTTPGNDGTGLTKVYDESATLYPLRTATYSIFNDALRLTLNGVASELAEGVENMQVTYGEDVDGDGTADRYVPAAGVTDMDAVVSVRISLLLASSEDGLADQAQQVTFNGQTSTASDRRFYQVVTATYAIRNRAL
jgi:type IV pilus assembly protein PilW